MFSLLELPKATVAHARAQKVGKTTGIQYDRGTDDCDTIGHDCGSSDSVNVQSIIQSHNSVIDLCHSDSGQYSTNRLGVASPCQHSYNHDSTYVTTSDSFVAGRIGASNGHSVSNVGYSCHGSATLDRVDFFQKWESYF